MAAGVPTAGEGDDAGVASLWVVPRPGPQHRDKAGNLCPGRNLPFSLLPGDARGHMPGSLQSSTALRTAGLVWLVGWGAVPSLLSSSSLPGGALRPSVFF